jgi:beta-lactam-binding protein with PASTA domain
MGLAPPGPSKADPTIFVFAFFVALLAFPYRLCGQEMGFTTDFETGDLRGWEKAGNAFDYQPTLGDNLTARGLGEPSNHQGSYWIGTFERFQGHPGQNPGDVQGDGPQGILTSAAFIIPAGTLSFLVGGGSRFETRVELVIVEDLLHETRIYYQAGKNSDTMERVTWDLHPYAGRIGRIRIVDASSQEWGHINADDFRFEGNVAVPDVVGHNLKEVKKIFAGAGLELGQVTKVSSDAEPDTVLRQDPAAETEVPIGTQVNLSVAQKEMIPVPDLRGHSQEEAEDLLKKKRLHSGEVVKRFSYQPEGSIVLQDPVAGTKVPVGTAVELWVAASAPVEVPDLRGRRIKEVEEVLQPVRLHVGQVSKLLSHQPEGTVVRQEPGAGTLALSGTAVDLWLAVRVLTKVPDVRGQGIEEARKILRKARLHLGQRFDYFSDQQPGTIVRQDPAAGTRVSPDSGVDVYVASTDMVDVPDLRGLSQSEAQELLRKGRLNMGQIHQQPANLDENLVIDQDPAMGTAVPVGSNVRLWVTARTAMVKVPDLAGRNSDQAEAILETAGLRLGEIVAYSSDQQKGTVLGQDPAAGAKVPAGTAVTVWTAAERPTHAARQRRILTAAIIVLAIGFYLLVRFSHDWAMSLGRAGRRVAVLARRSIRKRKNRTR